MQKGTIGVTTENIFPIIKKFLYSDHEIFLRELISNATDATQKLKALAISSEFKGETGDTTIRISVDKSAKTISVSDSGIGMTEEEVQKYINQIAFSSAGEFLDKYKDQLNNIIGHFGLGFYSSFMVSKKVEIDTLSWKEGAQPVKWSCEGDPQYVITKGKRKERGTTVTLYLDSESEEFAEESKINYLLNKYCKYLPVEIAYGKEKEWKDGKEIETEKDKIVNNTAPLWTKKPADLKEEDYLNFYRELYPMQDEPLFHIHLNVDYPFNLCADSRLAPLCTAGAGGTFKSEKFQFSIRGRDNMIAWAKKDHPGWEEIKKVINEIISGNNNMDENRVNPDEDDNVSDEMKEVLKADKEAEEEHQPTTLEEVPIAKSKKKKADLDDTAGEPLATTEDIPDIKMND
jgi:hypothetical protein